MYISQVSRISAIVESIMIHSFIGSRKSSTINLRMYMTIPFLGPLLHQRTTIMFKQNTRMNNMYCNFQNAYQSSTTNLPTSCLFLSCCCLVLRRPLKGMGKLHTIIVLDFHGVLITITHMHYIKLHREGLFPKELSSPCSNTLRRP